MSLNWNLTSVVNSDVLCFVDEKDSITSEGVGRHVDPSSWCLIELTMIVGINEITEANHAEFYTRILMYERVSGLCLWKTDDDGNRNSLMTADLVEAHVGLHTNASRKTKVQFDKWLVNLVRHSAEQYRARPH